MNKCSCVYVVAEKLTLSDVAHDFYLIIQFRKTTNELYTFTRRHSSLGEQAERTSSGV